MAVVKKAQTATTETAFQSAIEPIANMQEKVRENTEKGLEQARAQYETVKQAAEKATGKIEESVTAAQAGAKAFNLKAVDLIRTNANAAFDHFQALFAVKTASDFVSLQTEFVKKQADIVAAQSKELSALGQKIVTEAVEPVKSALVVPFKK